MYDAIIKALLTGGLGHQVKGQLLNSALDILRIRSQNESYVKLRSSIEMRHTLSGLLANEQHQRPAREFMADFTTRK